MAEVARYTSIPVATVWSWFRSERSVLKSDFQRIDDSFSVSFHDLIDALVASRFRAQGVTMGAVRKAYAVLQRDLKSPHPFCHRDLYTDGKVVIVRAADELGTPNLREAVSKQELFEAIGAHLDNVAYSEGTLLASAWNVRRGILVKPTVAMGQPVISGTGVTTHVVYRCYRANARDRALVASMFGLSATQVDDAVTFEEAIATAA